MATRASSMEPERIPLGVGFYTIAEAARLLRTPPINIRRWLQGYRYRLNGRSVAMPPLWTPELPAIGDQIELGFRDLVELRFVAAFVAHGVGLKAIRRCLEFARNVAADERPFSTRKFRTDGQTIFFDSLRSSEDAELLDIKKQQYVFKRAVVQTFRDLDVERDAVVRWRPYKGKTSIVIDPGRSFGQPIVAESGVPTVTLADAVRAEGSVERVAAWYDLPVGAVRDAVNFEDYLQAA